jgi:hypothetical protein
MAPPSSKKKRKASHAVPSITLATVEPYFVAFTVISGAMALLGILVENVPFLVLVCWFLFLAREIGSSARPPLREYSPSLLSAFIGVATAFIPLIALGIRVALFAFCSAGLSWLLLPKGPGRRMSVAWSLRIGG